MMLFQRLSTAITLALFAFAANAEETPDSWNGEAEIGYIATGGNSDSESLNLKGKAVRKQAKWVHTAKVEVLQTSEQSVTTAERYLLSGKSDYQFGAKSYMFGTVRYEDDRFSGFDYQVSEAVGYGRHLIGGPVHTLDLEAGLGGRHSKPLGGVRDDNTILRGAGNYAYKISESAAFTQDLLVESGNDNTFTESVTALKLNINSSLATKLSYTLRHNSDVPAGIDESDTITSITLVYGH